ncbi:DNA repair protein RecO [Paenibacillus sp. YYML68]|uniref:DNA repair protein RecO n=1 Tax=Paenibacillus sp. YYML68 TaxID=2909250 RepID=UPI002492EC07|nr:DNA repair protein RecO [Paenibacillus sp. YYML68]
MQHRLQGIVIRGIDYGEGNKIVTVFTKEQGKVSFVARGAKKVKSKFGSAVQLFTLGDYSYYKSGQLGSLQHAEIEDSFQKLRESLDLAAYASCLAELTERMFGDHEGHPYMFEQLKGSLAALRDGKDMQIVLHLYEMKMFMQAGYAPELEQCVLCRGHSEAVTFSSNLGGILCESCRLREPEAVRLTPGALKLLRLFQQLDVRRLGQIDVKPETKALLKTMMRTYFDTHIAIKLKSRDFLDQLYKYDL